MVSGVVATAQLDYQTAPATVIPTQPKQELVFEHYLAPIFVLLIPIYERRSLIIVQLDHGFNHMDSYW
ncbi:hypothetical protein SeLEV6574_g08535, partial [Synchytrium endobioticum]